MSERLRAPSLPHRLAYSASERERRQQWFEWLEERDQWILDSAESGWTQWEIADAVGLSQQRVSQILRGTTYDAEAQKERVSPTEVAAIHRLADEGGSVRLIAARLDIPKSTVHRCSRGRLS